VSDPGPLSPNRNDGEVKPGGLAVARQVGFVGVTDLDAAQRFYGDVLGLVLEDARPFALVAGTGMTQLRITLVDEVRAAPYTVLGWAVDDLDAEIDRLADNGVAFTRYDGMEQDDRGVWTAPSGARIAWFLDPDGNNLSLQG
jgi:catechol 2,3-dioxygenase-like lactoylglutathione lyase family enzyme